MGEQTPSLADVVAANVRRLREDGGWSQERLAEELRLVGLHWQRVTVALFEKRSGRSPRNVTIGEVVALAKVLDVPLSELLTSNASHVMIDEGPWPSSVVVAALRGTASNVKIEAPEWERIERNRIPWPKVEAATVSRILDHEKHCVSWWDLRPDPIMRLRTAKERVGDPERDAARWVSKNRKLMVLPQDIVFASERRWDRSLTEERDRRLNFDSRSDAASPAQLKALRGQIMRRLYRELAIEIDDAADRAIRNETREES